MRHRAAAFGGAEVRGGGENGPADSDCSRHGSADPWEQSRMGVPYACLPFGHLWWPSRRKFWRFGGQSGLGRAQNSRGFRDAPIGLGLRW